MQKLVRDTELIKEFLDSVECNKDDPVSNWVGGGEKRVDQSINHQSQRKKIGRDFHHDREKRLRPFVIGFLA